MKKLGMVLSIAACMLLMAATAFAEDPPLRGYGRAVVTVLPAHAGEEVGPINPEHLKIKVAGKPASVTGWKPLHSANTQTQLVLLIDGSAMPSLGTQMRDIRNFVKEMPDHTKMTIAYMKYGEAALTGPLSANPAEVLHGLHIPANFAYGSVSPYLCLSNLVKHWPSQDRSARRVVVMITDGVDEYYMPYDPEDPYVLTAIKDAVRARVTVYSLYWSDRGYDDFRSYENYAGQNLLSQVTGATGGQNFWIGTGNPVSFAPYFKELRQYLKNQYELSFAAPLKGKPEVKDLQLKVGTPSTRVVAPQQVYVDPAA